jgi:flagellar hook-associated protein 2
LLQVLKLDTAADVAGSPVVSTGNVGGINATQSFSAPGNAGFSTPVTGGTFTINGASIAVSTSENLNDVVTAINQSSAGVTASYNQTTGSINVTNNSGGPQSIILGSGSDTSNFLSASGLQTGTTTLGTQASLTYSANSGPATTVFSDTNTFSNVIPGGTITVQQTSATPYTVNVSQDSTRLSAAVGSFVSAYDAAVGEIDSATAAPTSTQPGGVLYGNPDVSNIKNDLVGLASGLVPSNGTPYNSLSSVGLSLSQSGSGDQFAPLNTAALTSALAANPGAVANVFNGPNGVVNQLASYLTNATGTPTQLSSSIAGLSPQTSLIQSIENGNTNSIGSLKQRIGQVEDSVNMQADTLRKQFTAAESQIVVYQALQSQITNLLASPFANNGRH